MDPLVPENPNPIGTQTDPHAKGGGLIAPESTTPELSARHLHSFRRAALPSLFPKQQHALDNLPAPLGELSQGIGPAAVALN
jgi:hypothetical protein